MIRPLGSHFFLAGVAGLMLSACAQEGPTDKIPEPAQQEQKLAPDTASPEKEAPAPQAKEAIRKGPHRGPAFLFRAALDELELRPDQKTTIEGLLRELDSAQPFESQAQRDFHKALASGVRAGKIDVAGLAPHYAALEKNATETSQKMHAALNKLHQTLDATQRQALVAALEKRTAGGHGPGAGACGQGCQGGCAGCMGGPAMDEPGDGELDDDTAAPPRGPGHKGMGMGRHGGMGFGPMAELDLTDAQKEKLRALKLGDRPAWKPDMQKKGEHMKEMLSAFAKDGFDANQLKPPVAPAERARQHAEARAKHLESVIGILEPAQREKLAARIESGPMGPMGAGPMGRMGRGRHMH